MSNDFIVKFRPFDKVKYCFDNVAIFGNYVAGFGNIVPRFGNNSKNNFVFFTKSKQFEHFTLFRICRKDEISFNIVAETAMEFPWSFSYKTGTYLQGKSTEYFT